MRELGGQLGVRAVVDGQESRASRIVVVFPSSRTLCKSISVHSYHCSVCRSLARERALTLRPLDRRRVHLDGSGCFHTFALLLGYLRMAYAYKHQGEPLAPPSNLTVPVRPSVVLQRELCARVPLARSELPLSNGKRQQAS